MDARACLAFALAAGVVAAQAHAQTCTPLLPLDETWATDTGPLADKEAKNISGVACAAPASRDGCLLVGDDSLYARLFGFEGRRLVPGDRVWLLPDGPGETDAEAIAYDSGRYYITGSHGMPRNPEKEREASRYFVYSFPVDPATGRPRFGPDREADAKAPAKELQRSGKLHALIRGLDALRPYLDQRPAEQGVNIEGLAVRDGVMHFGFRAPVLDDRGHAVVLSVRAAHLFGDEPDTARLTRLPLGRDMGIRDLAAVPGGFLVLSGPEGDVDGPADVFFWAGPGSVAATCLARLGAQRGKGVKPEALLVLGTEPGGTRVLVLHDGEAGGKPTEYLLPRPR